MIYSRQICYTALAFIVSWRYRMYSKIAVCITRCFLHFWWCFLKMIWRREGSSLKVVPTRAISPLAQSTYFQPFKRLNSIQWICVFNWWFFKDRNTSVILIMYHLSVNEGQAQSLLIHCFKTSSYNVWLVVSFIPEISDKIERKGWNVRAKKGPDVGGSHRIMHPSFACRTRRPT